MKTRRYQQKRRAQQQAQTRDRIVAATMALHEALGPRAASISAIAEKAGVQRLTVYRHFPDEDSLFAACTGRWIAENPPPAPDAWSEVTAPRERLRTALRHLYAYYQRTARMWSASYRDRDAVPALEAPMAAFEAHLDAIRDDLIAALTLPSSARKPAAATLGHALQFSTWVTLSRQGMGGAAMAGLVEQWLDGVAQAHSRKQRA